MFNIPVTVDHPFGDSSFNFSLLKYIFSQMTTCLSYAFSDAFFRTRYNGLDFCLFKHTFRLEKLFGLKAIVAG